MRYSDLKAELRRAYDTHASECIATTDRPWKQAERERFAEWLRQYTIGAPFEGIYESDSYGPKRFFALLTDDEIKQAARALFDTLEFRRLSVEPDSGGYHSLLLRVTTQPGELGRGGG